MFKFAGFAAGMLVSLILGLETHSSSIFFCVCSVLAFVVIVLVICFRLLASVSVGFWQVWINRWKTRIQQAMFCLETPTQIPQFQVFSVTLDAYGNRKVHKGVKRRTLAWGLIDFSVFFFLVAASVIILLMVLFCYCEGIFKEVRFRKRQKLANNLKPQLVWKSLAESAKKTLNDPLNESGRSTNERRKDKTQQQQLIQSSKDYYVVSKEVVFSKTFPSQLEPKYINQLDFAAHWQEKQQMQPFHQIQAQEVQIEPSENSGLLNALGTILSVTESASSIDNQTSRRMKSQVKRQLSISDDLVPHKLGSMLVVPHSQINNRQL